MIMRRRSYVFVGVAVGACLVVCLASQSWRLGLGERGVRVGVEFDGSGRLVLTGAWCDSGQSTQIPSISFYSVSNPAQGCQISFCGRHCGIVGPLHLIRDRWVYGDVPPGYVIDGVCPAIQHGEIYHARLGGRIGGDAEFRIGTGREVEVISKSCRLLWNW
jgi:hypothetical protein